MREPLAPLPDLPHAPVPRVVSQVQLGTLEQPQSEQLSAAERAALNSSEAAWAPLPGRPERARQLVLDQPAEPWARQFPLRLPPGLRPASQ